MGYHIGDRQYLCSQCGKTFVYLSDLKRHQQDHVPKAKIPCPVCQKKFSSKYCLRVHLRIHTRERPYRCSICEKTFTQVGNLKVHIRLHTNERPFSCDVCGKTYKLASHLNVHKRTHTCKKPWTWCWNCRSESTANLLNMQPHVKVISQWAPPVIKSSKTIIKFAYDTTVIGLDTGDHGTACREEIRALTSWCQDITISISTQKAILLPPQAAEAQRGLHDALQLLQVHPPQRVMKTAQLITRMKLPSMDGSMNLPPKVLQSIPMLMATVGFPFHYSIPPKTFLDPEDGEADALSLKIRLIARPPISVGTWLALDGLELHGVPLEMDLQFAPQRLLLAARDAQGLSTQLPLTLDLRRSPADPCHVFTLTAQRSLHSILRHRHRVELLLSKLSRFFNASSDHHLSVVSMRPGSTVVSWYNYSLCGTSHKRVRQCHVGQIQRMWLAMRSAEGSVKAAFREAMLPEFPITKVGPVSYRQDCFSTTSTPTFDGSTPAVHTALTPALGPNTSLSPSSNTCGSAAEAATSQQTSRYQWMAGMFAALLVVCLLILIVLLIATVLHFCKGHGRSRTVAIWPAGGMLSLQSRDLRGIRPRRPPLLQPELPPPPLGLWIVTQGDEGQLPSTSEKRRKTPDKEHTQPHPPYYDFSSI
ncbi:hypothetical protein L3Q82_000564 [Scortum barcoo]|uniref:Uncharacterized protein n=1 Tax=Scortum barcoo TaxID=214431 RepID=A0ACB8WEY9_9TELE|nr:hypothetical protein L3Q82_000564 [Scortum barcoo]